MNVHLIGDPHMGRKFETGVALAKRGLREKHQLVKLKANLSTLGVDYNVCVGDLFDHPHVGYSVVLAVANAYLEAAEANPNTTFVVLAGNHDLPRNLGTVGAFDAFEEIVANRFENLIVVRQAEVVDGLALFPWEWGVTAEDQLGRLAEETDLTGRTAIGHWDLQSYGGDDSHICPARELADLGVTSIYSGHYHIAGNYPVNGVDVVCTGSMEPYSHGEDPKGEIYVTLTLDEATDGRDLSEKCVRIILADGEELPDDLDCMALTAIKGKPEDDDGDVKMDLGKFEWAAVLEDNLKDLDPVVRAFIEERL